MVYINDADLLNFQDKQISIDNVTIGDRIEIVYNGKIAESYPAQIYSCYSIKLLD